MISKRRFFVRSLASGLSVAALVSCSLILKTDKTQCSTTGDCTARGPDYAGYICGPDNVCAKPGSFCNTNLDCINGNGGQPFLCSVSTHTCSPGCADSADGTISANQQCANANPGAAFICTNSQCVEGCADKPDGTQSGTAQCVAAKGATFICKNAVCTKGCAATPTMTANQVCTARSGHPALCVNDVCAPGCETNGQCIDDNAGKPFQCRKDTHQCSPLLLDQQCFTVLSSPTNTTADLRNDDTLNLGLYISLTGPSGNNGPPQLEGPELARQEWMKGGGGGLQLGAKRRPIAFVVCDNDSRADVSAKFLVDTVKVPAVLGPGNSGVLATIGATVFQAGGVLAISGAAGGAAAGPILKVSNGFLWRTVPSDAAQIPPLTPYFATQLEPLIHSRYGIPAATPLKFAVPHTSDAVGAGYANAIAVTTIFNGQSVVANGANYKDLNYGDPTTDPDTSAKQATAIADLIAFKPNIIFFGSRAEAYTSLTKGIEAGWTEPTYRPYYIFERGNFSSAASNYLNTITDLPVREALRQRMFGVASSSKNATNEGLYKTRHHGLWDGFVHTEIPPSVVTNMPFVSPGPNLASEGMYDATYVLFSAMIATQTESPTGAQISKAFAKTQPAPGAVITDIGPSGLVSFSSDLAAGKTVDLNGVFSDLNFNVENSVLTNVVFWCLKKADPANANKTPPPVTAGYGYDPTTTPPAFFGTPPDAMGTFSACPL